MKIKTETIIRTICLILALANQFLVAFGKRPLPITDEQINVLVSTLITIVIAMWNWWKNNSFTKEAIEADEYLARLKGGDAE
jgi:SPP1 family holin